MRHALIVVVWILFAACFILGIVLRRRFTRLLMEGHSAAYADLGAPPDQLLPYDSGDNLAALKAQSRFVQAGKYRGLGDDELNRTGDALRRLTLAQLFLGACFGALVAWEIAASGSD